MSTQPEALRLADELEDEHDPWPRFPAAAELRRLHADAEENEALRERLSALLRNTAIALRGPEPELKRWSWHDLPELAATLKAQRDALLEALQALYDEQEGPPLIRRHRQWQAAMDKARAAIAKAEEKT